MTESVSRRDVLKLLATAPLAGATAARMSAATQGPASAVPAKLGIGIVSRHLQFTTMEDAIAIAKELGFDSIEWNVRTGGHVTPERVATDLPRCIELTRQAGLTVPMITTSILDPSSPHAEAILATASALGVTHYRADDARYDYSKDLESQLESFKARFRGISALNAKYKMAMAYHTHSSAGAFGGAIWDAWFAMRELDPALVGLNLDIGHATRRLGVGTTDGLRIAHKYIRALAIKSFRTTVNPQTGAVSTEWSPTAEGQVNFKQAFEALKALSWRGPINIHYEHHGLLGSNVGQYQLPVPLAEFKRLVKADLDHIRGVMAEVGI